MDNGADAADLRRFNKACTQEGHRNTGQVKIEKNPSAHKEGARKELTHVLPRNPSEQVGLLLMLWIGWIHRSICSILAFAFPSSLRVSATSVSPGLWELSAGCFAVLTGLEGW